MYLTLPSYHSVKEQLIEKLRAKYAGAVTNGIATLLEDAGTLGKTFWKNGDYRKLSNLDLMYEARALLELALEIDPNSEQALRQLCEVIQTGWPIVVPDADQKGTQPVMMLEHQRRYDLFIATWRLWEEHLSKRPASSPEDIAYAYDLMLWTRPKHEIDDREAFIDAFNKRNPNPSPELTAYMEDGIPIEKRLAVARWALAGARQPESPISEWTGTLEETISALESGSKASIRHAMKPFFWDEVTLGDNTRYIWGRTFSFHGPQERQHRNPIVNQELYESNLKKYRLFLPKPGASARPKP